jgi:predicted transcriptional regulator
MQVRDSEDQLLYGLFQSICGYALDKGYRDIATMKNLLKLAMVDVCHRQYVEKPVSAAQMSVVSDLGISLRNVQYALKELDDLNKATTSFVKVRQLHREILTLLTNKPQSFREILAEVSYLIHAPYDLQKRAVKAMLKDLEQKGMITSELIHSRTLYRTVNGHVTLFDPTDVSARLSGLLSHLEAFKHTIGVPLFKVANMNSAQAVGLQRAVQEFLVGTGDAYEAECKQMESITKPYHFYLGCAPVSRRRLPSSVPEAILDVIQMRFQEPDSPSMARTHWYHLNSTRAACVFREVSRFLAKEIESARQSTDTNGDDSFVFYLGMADRQADSSDEGR